MNAELNLQAERADYEAWCIRKGYSTNKWPDGGYVDSSTQNGWEVWQAARRTVAAPIGAEALPPLPKPAAYEPNGREPTAYTAEQVRQAIAPHVERIRVLERALRSANLLLAETFISTGKPMSGRVTEVSNQIEQALSSAHIDGRTAGTAPDLLAALKVFADAYAPEAERIATYYTPEDIKKFGRALDGNGITPAVTMGDFRRAYEAYTRAAAPSSLSQSNEVKNG